MWQYNYTPDPDVLMHYGVKGMKWDEAKRKKQSKAIDKAAKKERNKYFKEGNRANRKSIASQFKSGFHYGLANKAKKRGDTKSYQNHMSKAKTAMDDAKKYKKAGTAYGKKARRVYKATKRKLTRQAGL